MEVVLDDLSKARPEAIGQSMQLRGVVLIIGNIDVVRVVVICRHTLLDKFEGLRDVKGVLNSMMLGCRLLEMEPF